MDSNRPLPASMESEVLLCKSWIGLMDTALALRARQLPRSPESDVLHLLIAGARFLSAATVWERHARELRSLCRERAVLFVAALTCPSLV
jgi:hypothetical protein